MRRSRFLTLSALYLATHSAMADDAAQTSAEQVTRSYSISSESSAVEQLASEFTALIGSEENTRQVIEGMRTANPIRLPAAAPHESDVHFVPPRPLSLPDIHTALSLVQAQLNAKGVEMPAPADYLRSSLVGGKLPSAHGEMTRVVGILPLHQRGMKWEQIARALRLSLPAPWSAAQGKGSGQKS